MGPSVENNEDVIPSSFRRVLLYAEVLHVQSFVVGILLTLVVYSILVTMNKKYAVVVWSDEPNNFSCVKISRILFDNIIVNDETQLLDQLFEIKWDKSSENTSAGKVIHVGSRAKMSKKAAELASDAANNSIQTEDEGASRSTRSSKKRKVAVRNDEQVTNEAGEYEAFDAGIDEIEENVGNQDLVNTSHGSLCISNSEDPSSSGELVRDLRSKLRKKERRIAKLKEELSKFHQLEDDSGTVDIGEGIMVARSILQELKSDYRHNPGRFLRKLMERSNLFSLEEIANSSLTGQKHRDGSQRPRFHFQRFKVCKEYTIRKCKLQGNTAKMMQFQKSIVNICTDARKRLRKNANARE